MACVRITEVNRILNWTHTTVQSEPGYDRLMLLLLNNIFLVPTFVFQSGRVLARVILRAKEQVATQLELADGVPWG